MPREDRLYVQLNHNYEIPNNSRKLQLFQQTVPVALSDQGFPFLVLAIVSDITSFKRDDSVNYRMLLRLPRQPIKILFQGSTATIPNLLTDREKEITQKISDGLSAKDIADEFFISEATVRTHRKNILEKTGAKNSMHLVGMAVANGWI